MLGYGAPEPGQSAAAPCSSLRAGSALGRRRACSKQRDLQVSACFPKAPSSSLWDVAVRGCWRSVPSVGHGVGVARVRAEVTRHGKAVEAVFDLLGHRENDLTAALGFTLSRSPRLVDGLLALFDLRPSKDVVLRMETRDEAGRTDLEIATEDALVVVEAKRGWHLPTIDQLERYADRVTNHGGGLLVTLSDCSPAYAAYELPESVRGAPLRHLPWSRVKERLQAAKREAGGAERYWLGELDDYLRRAVRVRDPASGWAYCVVVSLDRPGNGGERTFRDFVVNEHTYFHPFGWGSGWPTNPPNFLAFRWNGKVHQVRRVVSQEVVPRLQERWPDIPGTDETSRQHAVYQLGPPLPMDGPIPSGTNYRAARVWVLIDQLLIAPNLKAAIASSKVLTGGAPADQDEE